LYGDIAVFEKEKVMGLIGHYHDNDAERQRQRDLDIVSQMCQHIACGILKPSDDDDGVAMDYRYALTKKVPLELPSCCALTPADISKTAGFQSLHTLCRLWNMSLALGETDTYCTSRDEDDDPDLPVHHALQQQCHVEIGWRVPWVREFCAHRQGGARGFPLEDEGHLIVHNALRFLTLVSQYCPLTVEEGHRLNQASRALAELGTHAPEIDMSCSLQIQRRSQEVTSELSWVIRLSQNVVRMSSGGRIEGHSTTLWLPVVEILLVDNGWYELGGWPEDWVWKLEEVLGLQPPAVELPGFAVQTEMRCRVEE
jgi:hypothetical protein